MREIVRGASIAFMVRLLGGGLAFGFNVLVARILSPENTGVFFLAFAIITIANTIGRLGLDNALVRFIAAGAAIKDWRAVKGVCTKGIRFSALVSSGITLICLAGAPFISCQLFAKPELAEPLRWMSLSILPMTLFFLYSEMLKGFKLIFQSQLVASVILPAISILGLWFFGSRFGIMAAVWAHNLAAFAAILLGIIFWYRATRHLDCLGGHFEIRRLLDSSMPLLWVNIMNVMMTWLPIFLLGLWCNSAGVGFYSVANRVSILIALLLIAINSICAPKVHRPTGSGGRSSPRDSAGTGADWPGL